jgi:hypothetical protein
VAIPEEVPLVTDNVLRIRMERGTGS